MIEGAAVEQYIQFWQSASCKNSRQGAVADVPIEGQLQRRCICRTIAATNIEHKIGALDGAARSDRDRPHHRAAIEQSSLERQCQRLFGRPTVIARDERNSQLVPGRQALYQTLLPSAWTCRQDKCNFRQTGVSQNGCVLSEFR